MDARARRPRALTPRARPAVAAAAVAFAALGAWDAHAGAASPRGSTTSFCTPTKTFTAAEQDRLLRLAAVVRETLDASDASLALVARTGTDLTRFGVRYSHAGLSLRANPATPWAVRQLYYACDEGRPRLFDQGLAGFILGSDDAARAFVSIVLLPAADAASLERAALDDGRARSLLAGTYSANAHPYETRYQNCNQWVIELMADAWGQGDTEGRAPRDAPAPPPAPTTAPATAPPTAPSTAPAQASARTQAQRWLTAAGYAPPFVAVNSHLLMAVAPFIPYLHWDDHPIDDLHALRVRTSLPASIEAFVQARLPGARRIEACMTQTRIVVREGWDAMPACVALPGDRVVALD